MRSIFYGDPKTAAMKVLSADIMGHVETQTKRECRLGTHLLSNKSLGTNSTVVGGFGIAHKMHSIKPKEKSPNATDLSRNGLGKKFRTSASCPTNSGRRFRR
jgi:hypothetical protein